MKAASTFLTGLAVLALVLSGFFKDYPVELFCGVERSIVLDPGVYPIAHHAGLSYRIDVSKLPIQERADNTHAPPELHVRFFENGIPLRNELDHSQIAAEPGRYSHWDHYIAFSPREPGRTAAVYSIRYLELDRSWRFLGIITSPVAWWWIATACLLTLTAGRALSSHVLAAPVPTLLLLSLAAAIAPHVVKSWNQATVMADSDSYVRNIGRPPLYPWFIQATIGADEISAEELSIINRPSPSPGPALLRVIRAQRICFWASFLLAAWVVSSLVPLPLSVWFFFTLHAHNWLFPDLEGSLMSETLAQAFLLLVMAVFCLGLARSTLVPLPVLALAFSGVVLTRSAGVFALVFLIVAGLAATMRNRRRKLALTGALAGVALIGSAALGLLLWNSHERNGVWALSPLRNCERVAFALQCADAADVDEMPDAETRQFLQRAIGDMQEKRAGAGETKAGIEDFDLNFNAFNVAVPIAQSLFQAGSGQPALPSPGQAGYPVYISYVDRLFGRVADVVLSRHRDRHLRIVRHSLVVAVNECTRLKLRHFPFLALVVLAFLGCLIGRNRCAAAAAACLLAHLVSLAIICFQEMPLTRYVYFSEWVCLLGFLLAGWACGQPVWRSWRTCAAAENPEAPAPESGVVHA